MAANRIPGEGTRLPTTGSWGAPGGWGSASSLSTRALMGGNGSGSTELIWTGLEQVLAMPTAAVQVLDRAIESALTSLAHEMEQYAKDHAPWQDQTGDARAGLNAHVEHDGGHWSVVLGYDVDYGVFLETANGGQFAIVGPTIEHYHAQMIPAIVSAVGESK